MFIEQPTATCTVVQAGVNATPGQQVTDVLGLQSSKFSTTDCFTTTHGFVISAPPAGWASEKLASHSGGSRSSSNSNSSHTSSTPRAAEASSTPVGWSGLLEISRATGAPGVVGSSPSAEEVDVDEEGHIEVACTAHTNTGVRSLVKSVIRGLKALQEPEAAREGMGGTYFFPNEAGRKCAIFKPCDEEPLAPANPKGYVGRALGDPGWKSTVRVGEAAMREVAAYLLDHEHFAQVPHTVLVQAQHRLFNYNYAAVGAAAGRAGGLAGCSSSSSMASLGAAEGQLLRAGSGGRPLKLGSLQEFVHHLADTNEMGASRFRTRDVHAIGILDIRLFNTDRHAGNILVREPVSAPRDFSSCRHGMRTMSSINAAAAAAAVVSVGSYELIPIDHGFCLPEALEAPYFEWLHWPQACLPFDDDELAYIARLDVAADIALLQRELPNLRPECLRVLEVATTLLQRCAAAGLTLADIGALASRPLDALDGDDSCPSELEKACVAARQAVETRELTAMMSSSSCSSSGDCAAFSLREADEEGLDSSELGEEPCSDEQEQQEVDSEEDLDASMSAEQRHQVAQLQQQQRPRAPSRLANCSSIGDEEAAAAAKAVASAAAAAAGKASSSDLASVMSEGTVFNLATAMSLGSNGVRAPGDADLLFDLEDDPAGACDGSSGGGTPRGSVLRSLHGKGQLGSNSGSSSGRQDDVVMAGASPSGLYGAGSISDMEAEQLTEYLGSTQLLPRGAAAAPGGAAADARPMMGLSVSLASPVPAGTAGLPPTPPGVPPSPAGLPPIARSMQLRENWMLQGLKAKAAQAVHARCTMTGSKKGAAAAAAVRRRTGVQCVMYPPPVVRAAPRKCNEVLSGLSEEQWAAFVAELQAYMDDALRPATGCWRRAYAATGLGAAAMSCPRF